MNHADRRERELAISVAETALDMLYTPGGCDGSALWRLARVVGFLAADLDSADYEELVTNSLAEGKRGELV